MYILKHTCVHVYANIYIFKNIKQVLGYSPDKTKIQNNIIHDNWTFAKKFKYKWKNQGLFVNQAVELENSNI